MRASRRSPDLHTGNSMAGTQPDPYSMCESIVRLTVYPDIGKETARTQRRFWPLPAAFNGGRQICTHHGY